MGQQGRTSENVLVVPAPTAPLPLWASGSKAAWLAGLGPGAQSLFLALFAEPPQALAAHYSMLAGEWERPHQGEPQLPGPHRHTLP